MVDTFVSGSDVPRPTFRKQERMCGSGREIGHQPGLRWPVGFLTLTAGTSGRLTKGSEEPHGGTKTRLTLFKGLSCLERTVQPSQITDLADTKTESNWQGCAVTEPSLEEAISTGAAWPTPQGGKRTRIFRVRVGEENFCVV